MIAAGAGPGDVLVDLSDRHALITGAASGIGQATAAMLAGSGATVCLADCDEAALGVAVDRLAARGGDVWGHVVDVTDPGSLAALMEAVGARTGERLDILVANVGVMFHDDLETVTLPAWDACLRVNLTSVMLTIQAALPQLANADQASVVALSSGAGSNPGTMAGIAYASAKAGVAHLARVLGTRLGPAGIRVNAVAPGAADTAMTRGFGPTRVAALEARIPLGRIGTTEEVAGAILFLASPLASYVTGEVLHVSGGL